jgi:hypothetical protein
MSFIGPNHWWSNWPATFGYVAEKIFFPQSVQEISAAIEAVPGGGDTFIKAVGGGWSFTDAALPGNIHGFSIQEFGASGTQDLSGVLQGLPNPMATPMDLLPETLDNELPAATQYNYVTTTQEVMPDTGIALFEPKKALLIDIRGLASSLQDQLPAILSSSARPPHGTQYFHVEAGITMADLQQLLDHQKPRLAIQATGGNPLATLAGSLSTATHGGEFKWPLLVDRVRAIHLVGPGGQEWWIEGTAPIADQAALQAVYPSIDAAHFIGGAWAGIPGLSAEDMLKATVVSMGTLGVIYSVVLEVVEQFGIRQLVTPTSWSNILSAATTTLADLRSGDIAANRRILDVVLDGSLNGSGIPLGENVYADLAINPFTLECWITNRKVYPLPIESYNNDAVAITDYINPLLTALGRNAKDTVGGSPAAGRIFDFLNYAIPGINLIADANDISNAVALAKFLIGFPDMITVALATISAQAVANVQQEPSLTDRGAEFIGDFLTGFLHTLQGTSNVQYQFGNLASGLFLFFQANFAGGSNGDQILFYSSTDGHWWLGTFNSGLLRWQLAATSTPRDLVIDGNVSFWTPNFSGGAAGNNLLFYDPTSGNWMLSGQTSWITVASDTTTPFPGQNTVAWQAWIVNFTGGAGADQVLVYDPQAGNWWLGSLVGGATLSWAAVSTDATAPFGGMWTNGWYAVTLGPYGVSSTNQTRGGGQIMVVDPQGGGNIWLGTLQGSTINWGPALPPGPMVNIGNDSGGFWWGNFTGVAAAGDQLLVYDPTGSGTWSLGSFNSGALTWQTLIADSPFSGWQYAWPVSFTGGTGSEQILLYDGNNWWLGTINSGAISFVSVSSAATVPWGSTAILPWVGLFNGDTVSRVLAFDGSNWWLGTFFNGMIFWTQTCNTLTGTNLNSDKIDVSYKVGAIGWPSGGIPGRGLEIALDPTKAFTFVQNTIFDDLVANNMLSLTNPQPLIGYISIRVVPKTTTVMGMQQYSPYSVMVEIVGYRSPESDNLMDAIQAAVLSANANQGLNAMLHWGLENDQMEASDLLNTPLNALLKPGSTLTKIQAFQAVRKFFINTNDPCFDNNFTERLGI